MKNRNKVYEDQCGGHNCLKYKDVDSLRKAVRTVYERRNRDVTPYFVFLRELGLKASTPNHWKECLPLNLKILEDVKTYCEESIFNFIKDDKAGRSLVFKYGETAMKYNKDKEVNDEAESDKLLDPTLLGGINKAIDSIRLEKLLIKQGKNSQ